MTRDRTLSGSPTYYLFYDENYTLVKGYTTALSAGSIIGEYENEYLDIFSTNSNSSIVIKYISNNTIKLSIQNSTAAILSTYEGNSKIFNIVKNSSNVVLDIYHYNSSIPSLLKVFSKIIIDSTPDFLRLASNNNYFCIRNSTLIQVYNYNFANPYLCSIIPVNPVSC